MLPALLLLDVVAAWGLAAMGDWMRRWLLKNGNGWNKRYDLSISMACVLAILILQTATLFPYRPYYHSYYNPLLGGGQAAVNYITVGWGEVFDQAAVYLNTKEYGLLAKRNRVAVVLVQPSFSGRDRARATGREKPTCPMQTTHSFTYREGSATIRQRNSTSKQLVMANWKKSSKSMASSMYISIE